MEVVMEYIELFGLVLWIKLAIEHRDSFWGLTICAAMISWLLNQYIHTLIK